MTNEECKNILQSIKFILDNDSYSDEVEEALDMAIKALEAEPCEDCISREDAKNEIRRWLGYLDEDMITRINIGIDNLPSVTPSHEDLKEAYINGYDYGVKDWFKAKSQPCEDYISRETLVNELKCGYWNK